MSTAELFLQPEEIENFIRETLSDDLLYSIGEEGCEIGLCPYITFYVYHGPDEALAIANEAIAVFEEFAALIDEPFQLIRKNSTDWVHPNDPHAPTPQDLRAQAAKELSAEEVKVGSTFIFGATDQDSLAATARWAISGKVDDGYMRHSRLKLTFRHKWYRQNKARWLAFVQACLHRLQPEQCYSGFEVGNGGFNILGAYECDVLERICADHFYGMDIDHPSSMSFHSYRHDNDDPLYSLYDDPDRDRLQKYVNPSNLGAGLRTPTWCFLLSPLWLAKLGKTEADVRAELNDPRIEITAIPYRVGPHNPKGENALWIRLGELDLHPVEKGVPDLLVKANRLIRPVRCDYLKLLTLEPWDDDPNPRFDYVSSQRWMRRFDDDSDWPDAEERKSPAKIPTVRPGIPAGQVCPESGWWFTPAKADSRRLFKQGEIMPDLDSAWGSTIWQWDENQG